jgi:fatty-acyl-CoA synthase
MRETREATERSEPSDCGEAIRGVTISTLLREAALRHAEREAIVAPQRGVRITFAALDARVDALAAELLHRGLRRGDRAIVYAANAPDWIALQYALARIGAVLVTANPALKTEELACIAAKSRSRAIFFGRGGAGNDAAATVRALDRSALPSLALLVAFDDVAPQGDELVLDAEGGATAERLAEVSRIEASVEPGDLASVLYTSGTTGSQKGVMLSHRNLVENAAAIQPAIPLVRGDRLCLCVPLFHCFGCATGTLRAHGCGVTLILHERFDPDAILDAVEGERATAIYGVPTMYLAELEALSRRRRDLSSLRLGVMAGAVCPPDLVARVIAEFPLPGLVVAYGLTEASPGVTASRPDDPLELRARTVGRALRGLEVAVFDPASDRRSPRGERGELRTRGDHVMLGYDGEPAATAAAITADGWLRTGDLAIERDDAAFEIVGRIKELILRGGENIAPAEIEDLMRRHAAVLDAAAFAIPSAFFGEEIGVAVRLREGATASESELREFVRARAAAFKVPARIFFVDAFPITGSGKVQRHLLRESLLGD